MSPVNGSDTLRVAFGRGVCGNLAEAVGREWLVTDGLGGYAAGTLAGLATRRYHGLLVSATAPAGSARMLGLAALDAVVVIGDRRVRLATHEWAGGALDPRGHEFVACFDLDDGVPRWRYDLGEVVVEVELAMAHGSPTVAVVHRLLAGHASVEVTALCTWRDQHGERFAGAHPRVDVDVAGFVFESAYRVEGPGFVPGGGWYLGAYHRQEAARGLSATEDLWAAGAFRADLGPGQVLAVAASTGAFAGPLPDATTVVRDARRRVSVLVQQAEAGDDVDRALVRAADQFVVTTPSGPAAVAGYPWFGEWSRDLFTSYEGLFLCTGRVEEGRGVLTRAAGTISQGMLANTADAGTLEYNAADATLWFLHALGRHVALTGDVELVAELADTIAGILAAHRAGTRFGIGVNEATGLLHAGAEGWALTWMDALIGGWPVTPRSGYPVEIQALWINALGVASDLLARVGRNAQEWDRLRALAVASFHQLFPVGPTGLPDLLDWSGTPNWQCRPNQLLAAGLPHAPVTDPNQAASIVRACREVLVTSIGMRSLSPADPAYRGLHRGSPAERDAAYHQGTVWPWLIGPYADAARRAELEVSGLLDGLVLHLAEFGLGSVSETADGDPPHAATGCPFQAWSVAEFLRVRRSLRQ